MIQEATLIGGTTFSPATVAQIRALLETLPADPARAQMVGGARQILPDLSAARRLPGQILRRLAASAAARRQPRPELVAHPALLASVSLPAVAPKVAARTTARVTPGSLRQVVIPDPTARNVLPATSRVRSLRAARRGTAA